MELKATKKTGLERRWIPSLTQPVSIIVTVTIQETVLRWMNPGHRGAGGVVVGEKCDVAVVVVVVQGEDKKYKVLLKNKHVVIILLCFWYFYVIPFPG